MCGELHGIAQLLVAMSDFQLSDEFRLRLQGIMNGPPVHRCIAHPLTVINMHTAHATHPLLQGIVYGKPVHQGIAQLKPTKNLRALAEERVGRACGGLRVLNSYWINQVRALRVGCACCGLRVRNTYCIILVGHRVGACRGGVHATLMLHRAGARAALHMSLVQCEQPMSHRA
jgi:Ribosomal L15